MNTATSDRLIDSTVKPTSRAPRSAASQRRHAVLDVARRVLEHHDRVVDHEAGGDGERHQRQVVQAVAAQVHDAEGADERHRHRDAGNERRAAVAQEQEHDQDDQRHRDRPACAPASRSEARIVGGALHRHRRGRSPPGSTRAARAAARVTRSTVSMMLASGWRLMITSTDGLPLADAGVAHVLHRVDDLGHVGKPHRGAVAVGDDQRQVLGGASWPDRWRRSASGGRRPRPRPSAGWRWPRRARRARPRSRCRTC